MNDVVSDLKGMDERLQPTNRVFECSCMRPVKLSFLFFFCLGQNTVGVYNAVPPDDVKKRNQNRGVRRRYFDSDL